MNQQAPTIETPGRRITATHLRSLDEDEDTSMVTSLRLHLLSEHQVHGALLMDERDLLALHQRLHLASPQNHPIHDLRFRPIVAKSAALLNSQRCSSAASTLIAVSALPRPRG